MNALAPYRFDALPRELPDRFDIEVDFAVMERASIQDESRFADSCLRMREEFKGRGFHVHFWIDHARCKYVGTCTREPIVNAQTYANSDTQTARLAVLNP